MGTFAAGVDDGLEESNRIGVMWSTMQIRLMEMCADGARGRGHSGVQLLAEGLANIRDSLTDLEPKCRREIAGLHPNSHFDPSGAVRARNEASERRGVRLLAICSPRALMTNPYFLYEAPMARVGPVFGSMILMDRSCVVLPGANRKNGGETAWLCTNPELVRAACDVWDATFAASTEPDPSVPRYSTRQVEIARRRARGWTTARIARDLGISARTVTQELGRLPILPG